MDRRLFYDMDPVRADPSGGRSLAGNETLDDGSRIPGRRNHVLACTDQARSGKWRSCVSFGLSAHFCDLAGATIPTTLKLDGTSFLPVLEGRRMKQRSHCFGFITVP